MAELILFLYRIEEDGTSSPDATLAEAQSVAELLGVPVEGGDNSMGAWRVSDLAKRRHPSAW